VELVPELPDDELVLDDELELDVDVVVPEVLDDFVVLTLY
jgi:hypothetical protein